MIVTVTRVTSGATKIERFHVEQRDQSRMKRHPGT
jgi:hypothetical protein